MIDGINAAYTNTIGLVPGFAGNISTGSTQVPKAYICYILFNSSYTDAQFGYAVIDINAFNKWQKLAVNITVPYDGNMYIYVANESTISECYFDDIQIVHDKLNTSLQVTQSADYDPFGYVIEGTRYVNTGRLANNYLYQGDFAEFDEYTGWNRFALRGNYDSRLGRWHSADPYHQYASPFIGMGNNPVSSVDPDGGWSSIMAVRWAAAGAITGATIGLAGDLLNDGKIDDGSCWKFGSIGAVGFGLAGGAAFDQSFLGFKPNGTPSRYSTLKKAYNIKPSGFYSGIGNSIGDFLTSDWVTIANAGLRQVDQLDNDNCVFACERSVERRLGGRRSQRDFEALSNGLAPSTVGDWINRWKRDFS